jgi:hypothetical protein
MQHLEVGTEEEKTQRKEVKKRMGGEMKESDEGNKNEKKEKRKKINKIRKRSKEINEEN